MTAPVKHKIPKRLRAYRAFTTARTFAAGVHDPGFSSMIEQIDGTPLHESPPVRLFVDGEETFRVVIEALRNAKEEILIETYILRDDRIGDNVRSAMVDAVKRGIRVCLLVDAIGSATTSKDYWTSLTTEGVLVRHFHTFKHAPLQLFQRDHRKIIVVDRLIAFTGGMNIAEEYGSSVHAHADAWRDTFIEVRGTVANELAAVFAEGWDRARGPALPGLEYVSWARGIIVPPLGVQALSPSALRARVDQTIALRRDRSRGRRVMRPAHSCDTSSDDRRIAVLDPRPGRAQRETLAIMAAIIGGARERLWITTPYFAPPTRALRLLARAARDGVDVRLLLPAVSDVAIVQHAAHGAYSYMLANGVRVFEYEAAMLHAKTFVADGYASLVGSSNLDYRSFWLNAECNLLLFDHDCGAGLEQAFQEDLSHSREITVNAWRTRGLGHAVLDFAARSVRWAL